MAPDVDPRITPLAASIEFLPAGRQPVPTKFSAPSPPAFLGSPANRTYSQSFEKTANVRDAGDDLQSDNGI